MITIFNVGKSSYQLSTSERAELFRCIEAYRQTADGAWLTDVDFELFTYMWKKDLEGGDVQAIRPLTGDKIYLQPNGNNPDFWVQLIAPAAIHELRHVWQKKKRGTLVYSVLSLFSKVPCWYESAPLEKDAFDQQDKATAFIQRGEQI